jgi:hypothetical protein
LGERLDAAGAAHLAGRVDAEGAEERQVVDVDAELHFLVVADYELGGGLRRALLLFFIGAIEADRGVEHDVEVVALVADFLNLSVDVFGAGDRLVDRRSELSEKLLDLVVQGSPRSAAVNL